MFRLGSQGLLVEDAIDIALGSLIMLDVESFLVPLEKRTDIQIILVYLDL